MYYKITNGSVFLYDKTILESINIEIKKNDKVAIIGRNGSGKSTLLKALVDNTILSEGIDDTKFNIVKNNVKSIGYLEQFSFDDSKETLIEVILKCYDSVVKLEEKIKKLESKNSLSASDTYNYMNMLEEFKVIGGYLYKKEYSLALKKFGFNDSDYHKKISEFSGGEKTKIAILTLVLGKPDLLILDEPTNHLDIKAINWLEDYLKNYKTSLVIVSHDRYFMNKIVNKIYEIEYGSTVVYQGNYDYFLEEKKNRYAKMLKDYEIAQSEIKRLQRIADRFRYKPSKASMAMAKLKQIERIKKEMTEKPREENTKTIKIKTKEFVKSGLNVLTLKDLVVGYDKPLGTISLEVNRGDALGIIGDNGCGKSTLLKTLVGMVKPISGEYSFGSKVSIGYFSQNLETLDNNNSVYEEFSQNFSELNDFEIRSYLATFMFYESDINKKVEVLSGGEKVRLELAKIIYRNPNVLILDEPTNHLDIIIKETLESILKKYQGTILAVSHDRYFLSEVATSILEFKNGEASYYNLGYQEYLDKTKSLEENKEEQKICKKAKPLKNNSSAKLESLITKKEEELETLKSSLFLESVYSDLENLREVEDKIKNMEEELNKLMEELLQ